MMKDCMQVAYVSLTHDDNVRAVYHLAAQHELLMKTQVAPAILDATVDLVLAGF